jgi:hypothetical protein
MTFTSAGTQDGWVLELSENSNTGHNVSASGPSLILGDDINNKEFRSILSFKTSNLPDNATITRVMLKVKYKSIVGGGNPLNIFQGFMADIKTGFFTTPALRDSDFQTAASKTFGPTSPALINNWYSLNLTNAKTYINKLSTNAGLTQIRLHFRLDDNNNAATNYLSLFSGNATTTTDRPQLVITYYVP